MEDGRQSTSAEIEFCRKELTAVKETLAEVNIQLQKTIMQLETAGNDLANLLGSIDIPVIFLDAEFRMRGFSTAAADLMQLRETDKGRSVTDMTPNIADEKFLTDARTVLQRLLAVDREVRSHAGRWYLRRMHPYRTADNHVTGVVVTLLDIDSRKRAEQETRATQHRLHSVLELVPAAVVIVEVPGGRLLFANREATALFKHHGGTDAVADSEAFRLEQWPLARVAARNEVIEREEITVDGPDGARRVLTVSSAPIADADGVTVAVVGTFQDVTVRKLAERKLTQVEERFRLLVESARDFAIFYVDPRGRVMTWNPGAERILGWTEQEILGQSAAIVFTPEDRDGEVPERELRQANDTGRATDERWHLRKDGSRFWASGVLARVDNGAGGTEGFVKIMRDETDRKLAEEKLRAATTAAEKAQAAAVDAGRTKDEFISAVSHELRTPLSTIRLWARMLRNENLSAKDRDDGAQMIERAAVAQQRIVDDLFEVSRIASGQLRLTLQETDLADVIRTAMKAVEPELIGREIHLSSAIGPDIGIVLADPHRIRQVLGYLLKSTTKVVPAGGEVRVAAKRLGDSIYVVVSDGGTDIRDELLGHDPQVDAVGNPHGSDLGLLMARQIVDLHGGKISASAGEGEHAAFTMRLRAHRSTVRKTRD